MPSQNPISDLVRAGVTRLSHGQAFDLVEHYRIPGVETPDDMRGGFSRALAALPPSLRSIENTQALARAAGLIS